MEKTFLDYFHLPSDLALWLTLSGSNYPCLEQISMVSKTFKPLKFDCILFVNFEFKGNGYTFKLDNSCQTCFVPFWKWFFSKNSFLLEKTFFRRGLMCRKTNRKSQKLSPWEEKVENLPYVSVPFKHLHLHYFFLQKIEATTNLATNKTGVSDIVI